MQYVTDKDIKIGSFERSENIQTIVSEPYCAISEYESPPLLLIKQAMKINDFRTVYFKDVDLYTIPRGHQSKNIFC